MKIKILNLLIAIMLSCVTMPEELELSKDLIANNIEKPIISSITNDTTMAVGDSLRLSCSASGDSLIFKWFADSVLLDSSNSSTFKIDSLTMLLDSSNIWCIVQNSSGMDSSDSSFLQVLVPPTILNDPVSGSVKFGNDAKFQITFSGSEPLIFKWYLFDTIPQNSDSSILILPNTTLEDSGNYYKCIISNPVGSDTSKLAILSVLSNIIPPNITKNPSHLNKTVGNSASFYITATGTDIVYQWLRNDTIITNTNSQTYTIDSVKLIDHGSRFKCIASNPEGSDTSSEAILTVSLEEVAPEIIKQPDTLILDLGLSATFSIEANGTDLKYQWFCNDSVLVGENNDSYTKPFTTMNDSGSQYFCIINNDLGSDTSKKALLHIIDTIQAPVIIKKLSSTTVVTGNDAVFSIKATGTNCRYSWLINGNIIDSLSDTSVTFTSPTIDDSGTTIQCKVFNIKDTIYSDIVILHVTKSAIPISISTEPTSQITAVDSNATFTIEATGSDISYQWYKNDALLTGEISHQLNLIDLQFADSGSFYYCNLTNSLSDINTDTVLLHVLKKPSIKTEPKSQTIKVDSTVTFTVIIDGSGPFTYQWYENGEIITNATLNYYNIDSVKLADNGKQYSCKISNAIGFVISNSALLSVEEPPSIIEESGSINIATGSLAEFWITVTGTQPISYQWFVDGDTIYNADSNYYKLDSVSVEDNGKQFKCIATNNIGEIESTPFVLTVTGYPTVNITPDTLKIAENGTNFLKASMTGSGSMLLKWYKNNTLLNNENDSILVLKNVSMQDSGSQFYCIVENEMTLKDTSEIAYLKVISNPTITLKNNPDTINAEPGEEISLEVTTSGSPPISIQWYKNDSIIDGAIFPKYTIDSVTISDSNSKLYCIATNSMGVTSITDTVYLGVYIPISITNTLPNPITLENETFTFEINYTGSNPINVQWYKDGNPINGATGSSYKTPSLSIADNGSKYYAIASNPLNSDTTNISTISVSSALNVPYIQISPIADKETAPGYEDTLTPMFVCFAMDGNGYADGVDWLTGLLDSKSNPVGTGNILNFDNTKAKGTFFVVGSYGAENFKNQGGYDKYDLLNSWNNAYLNGHEIGNNTWSYSHGQNFTTNEWVAEIEKNTNFLDSTLNVPKTSIIGFRTPYLESNASTYEALKQLNMTYDCTIQFGYNFWTPVAPDTGFGNSTTSTSSYKKFFWPYTLNSGSPAGYTGTDVSIDGIWEIMMYTYLKADESGVMTGYDYNLWKVYGKDNFVAILQKNYYLRKDGNRCPFIFSGNTEYYSQFYPNEAEDFPNSTLQERKEAIEAFIDYVLTFPETRIVTVNNMLKWMKTPAPLR